MELTTLIQIGSIAGCAGALGSLAYGMAIQKPESSDPHGYRGLKRRQALASEGLFTTVEPALRYLARWVARLPLQTWRSGCERKLFRAGNYLGLTADEVMAASLLAGGAGLGFSLFASRVADLSWVFAVFATAVGAWLPFANIANEIARREKEVSRGLPGAIDLAALCMGAGLDFVGALKQIIKHGGDAEDVTREEFAKILRELELGHTRKQALTHFAERVPVDAVKDFTSSVIQSEEKGNPLANVLEIQAHMLRMRRSVLAEESAAKAGVKMMGPLMLMFAALLIILLGPMVITNMAGGF